MLRVAASSMQYSVTKTNSYIIYKDIKVNKYYAVEKHEVKNITSE